MESTQIINTFILTAISFITGVALARFLPRKTGKPGSQRRRGPVIETEKIAEKADRILTVFDRPARRRSPFGPAFIAGIFILMLLALFLSEILFMNTLAWICVIMTVPLLVAYAVAG